MWPCWCWRGRWGSCHNKSTSAPSSAMKISPLGGDSSPRRGTRARGTGFIATLYPPGPRRQGQSVLVLYQHTPSYFLVGFTPKYWSWELCGAARWWYYHTAATILSSSPYCVSLPVFKINYIFPSNLESVPQSAPSCSDQHPKWNMLRMLLIQ